MKWLFFILIFCVSCQSSKDLNQDTEVETVTEEKAVQNKKEVLIEEKNTIDKIIKTDEEWKSILTDQEYYVIRDKGTERPGTGELLDNKNKGMYQCRACGFDLFTSDTKFNSGTGWPSYYQPVAKENIKEDTDYNLGYARTEVMCARCDGHLGHVFPDGPAPTGLRYCINSVSLQFKKSEN